MKVHITFKDPDTLQECIDSAVDELKIEGVSDEELEAVKEKRKEAIRELCSRWFRWGEYVDLEVDTEKETITVIPAQE